MSNEKKPEAVAAAPFAPEQLKAMAEFLLPLLREANKPNEYEQDLLNEKLLTKRKLAEARKVSAVESARKEEERKRSCDHKTQKTPMGIRLHTWRSTGVHYPPDKMPYYELVCMRCQQMSGPIYVQPGQILVGMNEYLSGLDITEKVIAEWSKASLAQAQGQPQAQGAGVTA